MFKVWNGSEFVEGTPVSGDLVREYFLVGTPNEHYREYVYQGEVVLPVTLTLKDFLLKLPEKTRKDIRKANDETITDYWDVIKTDNFINQDDAFTNNFLDYLVTQNLLTQAERDSIFE